MRAEEVVSGGKDLRGMPKAPFALGSPRGIVPFERYFAQEVLP
jgi:hypothetical protein